MISIDGLAVEFSGTTLFKDINFVVNDKDRIALMGKNGTGKSTLLKILAGVQTPSAGKISAPKDAVIAYLPQHLMTENKRSLFEEASQAFADVLNMQTLLDEPTNHLDMRTKDILKQALMEFDGTLILVSHDRDFLDGLINKIYEFGNKRVKEHNEGIREFLERKKMEHLRELET